MRRPIAIFVAVVLASALVLGGVRRVGNPRLVFCNTTDEFSEFMPGLRLHALPMWNIGADVRSNFFKSMFYSPHGLGDAGFYYLASGALHALGLAISDRHLWLASAFTNLLLIAASVAFSRYVGGNWVMAYVAVLLLALAPLYVFSSQTGFGRFTFVPLLQVASLILAAWTHDRPGWLTRAALAALVFVIELTDGFYFGPVVLASLVLAATGSLRSRLTTALRSATFWTTALAITAGLLFDFALGALAASRDTTLTLFGYVRIRAVSGGVLSATDLLRLWMEAIDRYVPVVGPFLVIPAWLIALRYALADRAGRYARDLVRHCYGRHPALLRQRHGDSWCESAHRVSVGAAVRTC